MPFTLEAWKAKVHERLWDWRWRPEQAHPASLYGALCATALLPLVQAAVIRGAVQGSTIISGAEQSSVSETERRTS